MLRGNERQHRRMLYVSEVGCLCEAEGVADAAPAESGGSSDCHRVHSATRSATRSRLTRSESSAFQLTVRASSWKLLKCRSAPSMSFPFSSAVSLACAASSEPDDGDEAESEEDGEETARGRRGNMETNEMLASASSSCRSAATSAPSRSSCPSSCRRSSIARTTVRSGWRPAAGACAREETREEECTARRAHKWHMRSGFRVAPLMMRCTLQAARAPVMEVALSSSAPVRIRILCPLIGATGGGEVRGRCALHSVHSETCRM